MTRSQGSQSLQSYQCLCLQISESPKVFNGLVPLWQGKFSLGKKSVKFHTLGGGGRDKFGSFSLFFLLVLSHANMKRKVFFVGVVKFHTYFFYFD